MTEKKPPQKAWTEQSVRDLKTEIISVLEKPWIAAGFDQITHLPRKLINFYLLREQYGINDDVEGSGHTLATLAAMNGYFNTIPHFRKMGVDLTAAAPNGLTPLKAAMLTHKKGVLEQLELLGITEDRPRYRTTETDVHTVPLLSP